MADNPKFSLHVKAVLEEKGIKDQLDVIGRQTKIKIDDSGVKKATTEVYKLQTELGHLVTLTQKLDEDGKVVSESVSMGVKRASTEVQKLKVKVGELTETNKKLNTTNKELKSEVNQLNSANKKLSSANGKLASSNAKLKTQNKNLIASSKQLGGQLKTNGTIAQTFGRKAEGMGRKLQSVNGVLQAAKNAVYMIGQAIQPLFEFEDAQTELKKVTDLSGESLDQYTAKLGKMGQEFGKSRTEMVGAATEFVKSGFTEEQSALLARTAVLYQNIADEELDAGQAANFLISQMKAFNIDANDSIGIIDSLNNVSNNMAVSSADLATNIGKASSALAVGGNTYEDVLALNKGQFK